MGDVIVEQLRTIVGPSYVSTDQDILAGRCVDYTGRYRGQASALVRPGSTADVSAVLRACRDAGVYVTVQGGRTSLVAGTVPEHNDVLLSTERLTTMGPVDTARRRICVGAGVSAAEVQRAAAEAGLLFGVDLSARATATVGGMAATNAGGMRTVRYGCMGANIKGMDVVLPDGSVMSRRSPVRLDNTGYDLISLFTGAEGTLGVITELDVQLHPLPQHRITVVCGFADLTALLNTAEDFRDTGDIAALELIDGRCSALAAKHLSIPIRVSGAWLLLVEIAGDTNSEHQLVEIFAKAQLCTEPAVGIDHPTQHQLWQIRECIAEVVNLYGPPLKFDVSLPLSEIPSFASAASDMVNTVIPGAIPVLFGHIGEGNMHLNILGCDAESEARLYPEMLTIIAAHDGNVSSEHGVGSRKRHYLSLSRRAGDIAAMRTIKAAFDPTGYLNPAVLFH